jgi:transposase
MERAGHEVRLIAPRYVKPFIKRQKNDAADAEAIVEAALRPTMRYVEPKSGEQQARSILFRTREQFLKQRTEAINALKSHLYEFGYPAPEGIGDLLRLGRHRRSELGLAAARQEGLSRATGPDRAPDHPD